MSDLKRNSEFCFSDGGKAKGSIEGQVERKLAVQFPVGQSLSVQCFHKTALLRESRIAIREGPHKNGKKGRFNPLLSQDCRLNTCTGIHVG